MKCDQCGEKLNITPGKSVNFCSNCGNKVAVAQSSATTIDSVESAFKYIAENFGAEVLLGSKIVTIFADITRSQLSDEKDLIKILLDKGALDCLKAAMQKPASEQELSIKRAMTKLPKFLQDSDDADAMLRSFALASGWQLPKPQTAFTPKVVSSQKSMNSKNSQQLHKAIHSAGTNLTIVNCASSRCGFIQLAGSKWRVLAVENNKALLISERILENRMYNEKQTDITWENCTLRRYLNGDFYNKLGAVKSIVEETRNDNPNNQQYGTSGGNATTDKIFLLSIDEANMYFKNDADRIVKDNNGKACWWRLRSPGYGSDYAATVDDDGRLNIFGSNVFNVSVGVRPALWLNL
jgi:hypothetical protein